MLGNLSSQFFANVYLDALDQHVKHRIGARHYIRYVDDMVLLHESPEWLNNAAREIGSFVSARLGLQLNPRKTILQPIERGVDFVGQIIKPWRRVLRRITYESAQAGGKSWRRLLQECQQLSRPTEANGSQLLH